MNEVAKSEISEPVTAIFRRKIVPGKGASFLTWCDEISESSARYPGFIGTNLIRPKDPGREFVAIVKFDNYENFRTWNDSDDHREWVGKLDAITLGAPDWEIVEGINYWFAGDSTKKANNWPPELKMVVIAFLAIWPLVVLVRPLYQRFLPNPPILRDTLSTVLITVLMAYVTLPITAYLFNKWNQRRRK